MKIRFWGTRGSIPVPGESTLKFGGNTPCIQITTNQNSVIILDAGTGIRELGRFLLKENDFRVINLLIPHTHWDHIHGIPFFPPLFYKNYNVNIYSNSDNGISAEKIIDAQMNSNFFPVNKEVFSAEIKYHSIVSNKKFNIADVSIETLSVNHSKGTLSFKITENGKSLVYMTDNEIKFNDINDFNHMDDIYQLNHNLIEFCRDCDYLIHDSMYNVESFSKKIGWGHSNNVSLAYFSILANVKNLILFHYDPDYSDEIVERMYDETKNILSQKNTKINCIASREGMQIEI